MPRQKIIDSTEELERMEKAGYAEFTRVKIFGLSKDRLTATILTLYPAKITDQIILALTDQGSTELVSPDIPKDKWVYDVSRLTFN